MTTIVVESPTIASKVLEHLFKYNIQAQVMSTYGHLYDYTFDDENNVKMIEKRPTVIANLQELNRRKQNIIIATDPDEQGELISLHIQTLTPNCQHKRLILNDLSDQGFFQSINQFNSDGFSFNSQLAKKAFLLKILNLTLKNQRQKSMHSNSSLYLTTPTISILNALRNGGEPCVEHSFQLKIDNSILNCREITTSQKSPIDNDFSISNEACTTNDLYHANINSNVIDILQDSFETGNISYPRTNVNALPIHAINTIKQWTAINDYIHDLTPFSNSANISHYAIHNTAFASTHIERQIQSLNRIAIGGDINNKILLRITQDGKKLYGNSVNQRRQLNSNRLLSPIERVKHMLITQNASASTLHANASKYSNFLYHSDNSLQKTTVNKLELIAHQQCSKLLDMDINCYLEQLIEERDIDILTVKEEITIKADSLKEQIEDTLSGHHF